MKISKFIGLADYEVLKPLVFELKMPDGAHILDAEITLGHKSARLHIHAVHEVADKDVTLKIIGLLPGQEHADVREFEFVGKARTLKSISEIPSYYLFTAPRGE